MPSIELLKPRLDIAAQGDGLKVRAQALHLSLAAERGVPTTAPGGNAASD